MINTGSNNRDSGPLVRFYLGAEPDSSGRFIGDILAIRNGVAAC